MSDSAEYCREIEAYLCRKNDGHLIRIVGPAFERVCGWAAMGVPLAVAFRGIDRTFERYYRNGERRRPVRVEFCDADVLDAFDDWRRAVGVVSDQPADRPNRPSESLPAHLDRTAERLSSLAAARRLGPALSAAIEAAIAEIDALRSVSRSLRGATRAAALDRLGALDREMMDAARAEAETGIVADATRTAEQEVAPFAGRMPADARVRAIAAARDRLLRDRLGLPKLSLD